MELWEPNDLRQRYSKLTGGRSFDTDLGPISLEHGTYYVSAEDLCERKDEEEAEQVRKAMFQFRPNRLKKVPRRTSVVKAVAKSLANTRLDRRRRSPFYESNFVLTQVEMQNVLLSYGKYGGNPLAYMFDEPLAHVSVVIPKTSVGTYKKNGVNKWKVADALLVAYSESDRTKRILGECYSPIVWGFLKAGLFTDEYVAWIREDVKKELSKLINQK